MSFSARKPSQLLRIVTVNTQNFAVIGITKMESKKETIGSQCKVNSGRREPTSLLGRQKVLLATTLETMLRTAAVASRVVSYSFLQAEKFAGSFIWQEMVVLNC